MQECCFRIKLLRAINEPCCNYFSDVNILLTTQNLTLDFVYLILNLNCHTLWRKLLTLLNTIFITKDWRRMCPSWRKAYVIHR